MCRSWNGSANMHHLGLTTLTRSEFKYCDVGCRVYVNVTTIVNETILASKQYVSVGYCPLVVLSQQLCIGRSQQVATRLGLLEKVAANNI
jgi:hypothetical protein